MTQSDSITPESLTNLAEAHQAFINYLKSQERSTSTILAYGKDIEQLIEFALKTHNIEHLHIIQTDHLNQFKTHLEDQKYTAKSISRKINSIKSFFRFLKQHGHVNHNPADQIKHPRYQNKTPRVLSKTEYRALRDACREDIRTSTIVELLLQTGIRIGELANLKISNIQNNHLIIEPYESQKGREVPLNKAAQNAMTQWLAVRPNHAKTNHVFITKNGRPLLIRNIRTSIDRYFKLAGIDNCTVNDLRHTWIAHHLANGASLVMISTIAGHKRLSTTGKYLQFIKDKLNPSKVQLEEL
jgi:site-specific recombinase XerD